MPNNIDSGQEDTLLSQLSSAANRGLTENIEQIVLKMDLLCVIQARVPDAFVDKLLEKLRLPMLAHSPAAACMLSFFEFEAPRLTDEHKQAVSVFLQRSGALFTHENARLVVEELLDGDYLKHTEHHQAPSREIG